MTIKTVLTSDQVMELFEWYVDDPEHTNTFMVFARAIEQAVLAKLAEQEPVAWVAKEGQNVLLVGAATKAFRSKEDLLEEYYNADPVPLYAHPAPHVDNKGE